MFRYFWIIISFIGCLVPIYQNNYNDSIFFDITYLFIVGKSIFAIYSKKNVSFSFYKMFYTFVLFFFGIAPYIQYTNKIVLWTKESPFSNEQYIETNLIIITIIVVFEISYNLLFNSSKNINHKSLNSYKYKKRKIAEILLIFICFLSLILTLYSKNWEILPLFFRGGDYAAENQEISSFFAQIIDNFFRPISIIIFIIYFSYKRKWNIYSFFFLLLGLFCNFPTGLARYNAAALYIPLIIILVPKLKLKYYFNLILIMGLLIVFPFLNNFRYFGENTQIEPVVFDFSMFAEGHFDSYSSLLRIVQNDIVTYGNQLLGVLLFWVPREIWHSKPIGSGAFMAKKLGFFWDNVSCNYFAEGYINFGFLGIFLFTIILAYISANADVRYLREIKNQQTSLKKYEILYILSSGFMIFLLRGDLLSSFAYLIGFISSIIFANNLMFEKIRIVNNFDQK